MAKETTKIFFEIKPFVISLEELQRHQEENMKRVAKNLKDLHPRKNAKG